jgi:uncharacterized damage-inducible protein DinB
MDRAPSASFSFPESRRLLETTPAALRATLAGLPSSLFNASEGPGTWNAFQVLCHLAHGETDDWIPRVRMILESGAARPFVPFDREAGFVKYAGWSGDAVLDEFARLRAASLRALDELALRPDQLELPGLHPTLGPVTLGQLLACWVTHDMAHLAQIARVLARHHGAFVGPWRAVFSLLRDETA